MALPVKVEFEVPATMRDGTVLKANIFRPAEDGEYPVLMSRTPYGKQFASVQPFLDAVRMASAGYIVVIQDVRGCFASAGEWTPFVHEGADGYDSVEWAVAVPGSNGNVGMYGASYVGFTQWAAAMQNPPHLKAIMPAITWADVLDGTSWRGGAFELGVFANWTLATSFDPIFKRYAKGPLPEMVKALHGLVWEIDHLASEGYSSLPLKDFAPFVRQGLEARLADIIAQPNSPELGKPFSVGKAHETIHIPAYNIGGWYDIFLQGTLQNFSALRTEGSSDDVRQAKLLIGPWAHINYSPVIGEMDFGFKAQLNWMNLQTDMTGLAQRWFDRWLKGMDNGITQEPPVKLFVMGDNIWRDEQEWPLARTQYTPFYLHSAGSLSTQPPTDEPGDSYTYDPANPVTTRGGAILMHASFPSGVQDQQSVESRDDVLVYTSDTLTQDSEVTGPIIVKLWACSDAADTDFVARLVDVYPNGFAQNLTDGIIRARYRKGNTPEMLEPGKAYEFTINLWSTANVFKAGHRIRLDVTSSNFPRWDRNPNTGAPFGSDLEQRPAHQTILHDSTHPSHVVLPIIPR